MPHLTSTSAIRSQIAEFAQSSTLWIDTEVADYRSNHPRLSLIQVLDEVTDMSGDRIYLLDVLDSPEIVADFISQIMTNSAIEKVFHNASYDLKFLGNKKAKNVTCTLEMAKKIPYYILPLPNYQLKTLAAKLCKFLYINKQEQTSDWGQRPLSEGQIEYAYLDCIYLAQVHLRLIELTQKSNPEPKTEDLTELAKKYQEVEQNWKIVKSEYEHLQERIKKTMQAQNLSETSDLKLNTSERTTIKVALTELVKLIQSKGIELDLPITLTQKMQKDLGDNLEQLLVNIEKTQTWRLSIKTEEGIAQDE
ncbi:MAG: ribonuclease D [Pelatocladus maniniholoensis HA4357-MV3]|jgi:ribonuclease D|uniref:Ribonuclease D n=1 Tax=Pelatocladus maniniholoensis HA4357-MV3 TaxID=1117104 RepID=A0A9E3LU66_9NOST|nr:ribonuclease D [Pelatocladus maniniholoensis HA4357-MV3]BAZ69700.1 3'-5' exonuclease [Fischerella sp. NIES-4106]